MCKADKVYLLCSALYSYVQWVYPGRPRDRGGRLISDVIDIDAEEAQFEVDGSGDGADDDDDVQSGDDPEDESSGGTVTCIPVLVNTFVTHFISDNI